MSQRFPGCSRRCVVCVQGKDDFFLGPSGIHEHIHAMGHESSPTSVVVVGAGVAGLFVARALARRGYAPTVLEASSALGGRVRTVREDDGRVAYEAGPWRVPSTHARVRALCREFGLALAPAPTPPLHAHNGRPEHAKRDATDDAGLTTWEAHALRARDPARADAVDLATGYAGRRTAPSGRRRTTPRAPRRLRRGPLRSRRARARARRRGGATRGRRGDGRARRRPAPRRWRRRWRWRRGGGGGRYALRVRRRVGSNAFADGVVRADVVFVCVPPHACREWSAFRAHARSTMAAVEPGVLHHVYARDGRAAAARPPRRHAAARADRRLAVPQRVVPGVVQRRPRRAAVAPAAHGRPGALRRDAARRAATLRRPRRRRRAQPPLAVRVPRVGGGAALCPRAPPGRARRAALLRALPRVYLAGEAFSSFQAWIEGALETAELALDRATPTRQRRAIADGRAGRKGDARPRALAHRRGPRARRDDVARRPPGRAPRPSRRTPARTSPSSWRTLATARRRGPPCTRSREGDFLELPLTLDCVLGFRFVTGAILGTTRTLLFFSKLVENFVNINSFEHLVKTPDITGVCRTLRPGLTRR